MKDERDMIVYAPEKEIYCTYFLKEIDYLTSKYKDPYLNMVYLYYLQNKAFQLHFKTNKSMLKEMFNCMSEPKLIECKKILLEENILEEVKNKKGKVKFYKFNRIKVYDDQLISSSEDNPNEPLKNIKHTTKRRLVVPLKNIKSSDSSKPLENQQVKPDFEASNINNINNNKIRENNNKLPEGIQKKSSPPFPITQEQYIKDLQDNDRNVNSFTVEQCQQAHTIIKEIKSFFNEHAPYRMQDLSYFEMPGIFNKIIVKLVNINNKVINTKIKFVEFLNWLGNDENDVKKYVIGANTFNILDKIDNQMNIYIETLIKKEKEQKKKNTKPFKPPTDEDIERMLRS